MSVTVFTRFTLALASISILSSCDRVGETMEITETREVSEHNTLPKLLATSGERFYEPAAPPAAAPQENPLTWLAPEGWTEAPEGSGSPMSMRLIDLRFGPNGEGECMLAAMPGGGGGVDANINRWRTQMGQQPYTADELAALPKKSFLGRDATYVEMDGDYTNVGQAGPLKNYRLLGLVQPAPEFTLFVKLTGPKDLVEQQTANFEKFYQSISIKR